MRRPSSLTAGARFRKCLPLLALAGIQAAGGAPASTSVELFVDHSATPLHGPDIRVPTDASTLTFSVKPRVPLVRFKLEGIDQDWTVRTDQMFFMVRFLNEKGDQLSQMSFPATRRSAGWRH